MKKDLHLLTRSRDMLIKIQEEVTALRGANGIITKDVNGKDLGDKGTIGSDGVKFYTMSELGIAIEDLKAKLKTGDDLNG